MGASGRSSSSSALGRDEDGGHGCEDQAGGLGKCLKQLRSGDVYGQYIKLHIT